MLLTLFVGFAVGALAILVAGAVGILFIIRRLNRRSEQAAANSVISGELDPSFYNKQGVVRVLESEQVPNIWLSDKGPTGQKPMYAKIKSQSLILTESDIYHTKIMLKGCIIVAVSATSSPSTKWDKGYPIKVESKTSVIYNGSKTVYLYLETSCEKESWCKALRIASCCDKEKLKWFSKLNLDFQSHHTSLTTGYPSFMQPSMGLSAESIGMSSKVDNSFSKVCHFMKKLAKMAFTSGLQNKSGGYSTSYRESRLSREPVLATGLVNTTPSGEALNSKWAGTSSSRLTHTGSTGHISVVSEADSDDKIAGDEGTVCWNLLMSWLFFYAKSNEEMKSSMKAQIQRTLSNMRIPSYIGQVTFNCTGIDPGNIPPYIRGMRVLPSQMNEVWVLEIDIEYSGGAGIDIETRREVCDGDFQEDIVDTNLESSSVKEVTPDLLEGFEQLKLSEGTVNEIECKEQADPKLDRITSCKSTSGASSCSSRWKSIINSIAKQVSQVPLSLRIRLASIQGTMQLHVKAPSYDQLWFGFTSMPDIDFNLESFVGEYNITIGRIALFLKSRIKTAIRETLVLPNCKSVSIPWMLAEKDDWVPFDSISQPISVPPDTHSSSSSLASQATLNDEPVQELTSTTPLLSNGYPQETCQGNDVENPECLNPSRSVTLPEEPNHVPEGDDTSSKRIRKRDKMLTFGKKMFEKSEEKRRNTENDEWVPFESISQPISVPPDTHSSSSSLASQATLNDKPVQELTSTTPLLSNGYPHETCQGNEIENPECLTPSRSVTLPEEPNHVPEGDDTSSKRIRKRDKILTFGKKMFEKSEEKRHNTEKDDWVPFESIRQPISVPPDTHSSSSSLASQATLNDEPVQELTSTTPLLSNGYPQQTCQGNEVENPECLTPSWSVTLPEEPNHVPEGDDTSSKRIRKRDKILTFGKKMFEKSDEKRRNTEKDDWVPFESIRQPISVPPDTHSSSSSLASQATLNDEPVQELTSTTPLLSNGYPQQTCQGNEVENPECLTPSRSVTLPEEPNHVPEGDDTSSKRIRKRDKMLTFGKKMFEKSDEKRRNTEKDDWVPFESIRQPISVPPDTHSSSSGLASQATLNDEPVQELTSTTPLLSNGYPQETCPGNEVENPECLTPSRFVTLPEEPNHVPEGDDTSLKRIRKRDKMLTFGKKMFEKSEEKVRHIVETTTELNRNSQDWWEYASNLQQIVQGKCEVERSP